MEKIEILQPANVLLYKKGYSIDFIKKTIDSRSLSGLCISDHLDRLSNLDFLAECNFLTHLRIGSVNDPDYSFLKRLVKLKRLFIGMSYPTEHTIDLSAQTELNALEICWRKHIVGLEQCQKLEQLILIDFTEKDLSAIRHLAALKELTVNTGKMVDLTGIEGCKSLDSLKFGNCKSLTTLGGLNHLPSLCRIGLDAVTKAKDYGKLDDLPSLTELKIVDCKEIPSIGFVSQFRALKKLIILGNSEVTDGDMTPVRTLEKVFYTNRKHYNIAYPPPNLLQRALP